jgi:hypothetical protein
MRDVNGLEQVTDGGINGVVVMRQTLVTEETADIEFTDEIFLDSYFVNDGRPIAPNTRCMVTIGLRYSWGDSPVCPDFRIIVTNDKLSLISKEGLDDYPNEVNSASVAFVLFDVSRLRVKLAKTDLSITRFQLLVNSFIRIEVI